MDLTGYENGKERNCPDGQEIGTGNGNGDVGEKLRRQKQCKVKLTVFVLAGKVTCSSFI